MAVEIPKEKWGGQVNEVTIGATEEDGGTRTSTVTVGGSTTLPCLSFEGENPNKAVVAIEILDEEPQDWPQPLVDVWGDVYSDPAEWAKKAVDEFGAELLAIRLTSANPVRQDRSPAEIAETVKEVLDAVGVPLIVIGCGDAEKDNEVLKEVAQETEGENLLIGFAEEDNYKTIAGACMIHGHTLIAQSPVDVNIAKQLNIQLTDFGIDNDQIVIDPLVSSLGYGMEYSYSVMERARLGAIRDDKMLCMPMINFIGDEAWGVKEPDTPEEENPGWGEQDTRGIMWETMNASTVLQSGADILVMRHPKAAENVNKFAAELVE
ncbi:acetyl-CoA decarbonylase/synthase complex subunit delta [Fuchsiella alkaliacetigena]|uniref:acetyl-CoA decarbonylase/synthase complex subunit delta n=1 Tax=Fuchsiella alkaliacetigena TaxID=957042 RepID=UPI00200AD843|nr:acetyl-CoA decarbonylase/synthase complex subunit delta [Fuchsiella alkaliacetigena]MCK8823747.1 acetyl-CoA decarbonylase/synthase complex subunit delta [Fuchsiella alkaliacetigena]